MWRRVASQSPQAASGPNEAYIKAFSALGLMLRDGRSLSGHERHCCFLNTRDDHFATVSAATGLDFPDDGRAITAAWVLTLFEATLADNPHAKDRLTEGADDERVSVEHRGW